MYIFVYGTLKNKFESHELLEGAEYISDAFIHGNMFDLLVGFPGVTAGGPGKVYGEIYEINEALIRVIDDYEGFYPGDNESSVYTRVETEAYIAGKRKIIVNVYIMDDKQLSRYLSVPVVKGIWRNRP